jgi:hypothetical protein
VAPTASGTLYFANNKVDPIGSNSIDVLVGQAQNAGLTPPFTINCYADWNPQYSNGTSPKLTVTEYDSSGPLTNPPPQSKNNLSAGNCYPAIGCKNPCTCTTYPTTSVATITYNADGSFTLN